MTVTLADFQVKNFFLSGIYLILHYLIRSTFGPRYYIKRDKFSEEQVSISGLLKASLKYKYYWVDWKMSDFKHFWHFTAWKVSKYGVISGPYFPVFELNMEIYSVNLRIQVEYKKIRTRNNSVFGHFSRSACFKERNNIAIEKTSD